MSSDNAEVNRKPNSLLRSVFRKYDRISPWVLDRGYATMRVTPKLDLSNINEGKAQSVRMFEQQEYTEFSRGMAPRLAKRQPPKGLSISHQTPSLTVLPFRNL